MSARIHTLQDIQRRLENLYGLERTADVTEFVQTAGDDERETLLLRQTDDGLEIALVLPAGEPRARRVSPCDLWLQLAEGVSHFVYVTERARTGLPTTQLELELQAEVDKYILWLGTASSPEHNPVALRDQLFENVSYLHPAASEAGARYRLANDLAAKFVTRLVELPTGEARVRRLRRFYRAGQADKIRLSSAA